MNALSQFATTYTHSSSNADGAAAVAAYSIMVLLLLLAFVAVVYVIYSVFLAMIFKKAGIAAWKAWVPIYNNWTMLELGGQKGFWAVLALVPVINIAAAIFMFIAMYEIGLRLGKSGGFVILAIFLPYVWLIWLAVDRSTWHHDNIAAPGEQPAFQPPTQPRYDNSPPTPPLSQ